MSDFIAFLVGLGFFVVVLVVLALGFLFGAWLVEVL